MKFTTIIDSLSYPTQSYSKLSTLHADMVAYVIQNFINTRSFKEKVIKVFNLVSYYFINSLSFPAEWRAVDPFCVAIPEPEDVDMEAFCRKYPQLILTMRNVEWDIDDYESYFLPDTNAFTQEFVVEQAPQEHTKIGLNEQINTDNIEDAPVHTEEREIADVSSEESTKLDPIVTLRALKAWYANKTSSSVDSTKPTPKEDLYLQPPKIPRMDVSKPIFTAYADGTRYAIYTSLPLIPTRQNEISTTTDFNALTDKDFLNLFPNRFIPTRAKSMYDEVDDVYYDVTLGNIIQISGYSLSQCIDCVVRYPHLYKFSRILDGRSCTFYTHIEIDGELYKITDVWDDLEDCKMLPKTVDYMKEYVARRYLLERDAGVQHKYPLFGTIDPFLTLFTTAEQYAQLGYYDSLDIAKQCVKARIRFKRSRNPVLRKFLTDAQIEEALAV